jgi:oxalate decarboxylase/phosphoglucose isomerase-like protein (cupin superfamily)
VLPPDSGAEVWIDQGPVFVSQEAVEAGKRKGMIVFDLAPGDLLYFPGHWFHEVHNLTPSSVAVTNAVKWPEAAVSAKKATNILNKRVRNPPKD